MNRRVESNHALAHAAELANAAGLPLLVYEGLTCDYKAANDRLHTFILEGVPDTAERLAQLGIGYHFHLRARLSDPNDVVYRLAADARCVVTDDYPSFIAADHNRSVPDKIGVAFAAVDSSCIIPMSCHEKRAWAAYTIRPKIHRDLARFLKPVTVPRLQSRWRSKPTLKITVENIPRLVAGCEINHSIRPSACFRGGYPQARRHLDAFLQQRLYRYAKERNEPARHATSDLSPYLHFGQISSLDIAFAVKAFAEENRLIADEFLEELIVRRELAFNFARWCPNPESLEALPAWCLRTLTKHDSDPRPFIYTEDQFEYAQTHDALWNACQAELLIRGKIHGYYRMYWGKKIIEWSATHARAHQTMLRLHDIYALDGRDPNTYTNILWCFGLHDRPWAERPIFGQIRYMGLDGMKRKTDTVAYLNEIAELKRDSQ